MLPTPVLQPCRDRARLGEGRRGSCCDVSPGAEDAPGSLQTLPGAAWCQCCVQALPDPGLVSGVIVRGRENQDGTVQHFQVLSSRRPFVF